MGLKLIFLTVSSGMSLLKLSRREDWWKDAETLMLRHQLAIALRERPRAPEPDMAGPGVAGSACRDAAHRPQCLHGDVRWATRPGRRTVGI